MAEIVGIRFKEVGKIYYFDPDGKKFNKEELAIVETARPTDDKRELSEEQKQIISKQLYDLQNCIKSAPYITVVFFEKDRRKTGGTYRTVTGTVKKVDEYSRTLEMAEGLSIPFEDILSLDE